MILERKRVVSGIYVLLNKKNNKLYIGSALNAFNRCRDHFGAIRGGYHKNPHLARAVKKYGEENFEFHILFECEKENLIKYEQFFMDFYNVTDKRYGYNIVPRADRSAMSQETRDKISKFRKGKPLSPEHCLALSKARKGKIGWKPNEEQRQKMSERSRRFILLPENREKNLETLRLARQNIKCRRGCYSDQHRAKFFAASKLANQKPVIQYNLNGDFIKGYPSCSAAARELNVSMTCVNRAVLGVRKTFRNSLWKYFYM